MKRKEYIDHRNRGTIMPIYEYYKEHYKSGQFLSIQEFMNFFQMWPPAQQVAEDIFRNFDVKFEVMKLENLKTGQILKYY